MSSVTQQRGLGNDVLAQRIITDAVHDPDSLHNVPTVLRQFTEWWQAIIVKVIQKDPSLADRVGPLAGYHPGRPLRGGMSAADSLPVLPVHYTNSPMMGDGRRVVVLQGSTEEACDACKSEKPDRTANLLIGGMTTMQANLCKCVLQSDSPQEALKPLIAHGRMIDSGPRLPQADGPLNIANFWGGVPESEVVRLRQERLVRPSNGNGSFTSAFSEWLKNWTRSPARNGMPVERHI
ncbi:hypothetical protein A2881_05720 [Candidatus Peribacteria bacterium RIFCSPHIGHO2_01_FULL_55_13]|nr:MAG: hypothetical protein A2881_05720 [Candidatus Peribacteria bacterium RIFCSPHIGHO2_01_FULL_55_13]OGJ65669.1 MAG: hypothetical protein A3F36_04350 [Candidatus Peribacteria bacterium RIFCSPHIGHO2_12_FULL_55_11]